MTGRAVRDRASRGLLGRVTGLLIHPETGAVLAIFAHASRRLLVQPADVLRLDRETVWVAHPDAVVATAEIVRVQQVLAAQIPLIGNRVFTVSRVNLGDVLDTEIDTKTWQLTQLRVGKKVLGVTTREKLIAAREIVQIKKTEVTVRDATVKTTATERLAASGEVTAAAATCNATE